MEETSCPESNSPPSSRSADPGTAAGSSARNAPCSQSRFGRSASVSSNLRDLTLFNLAIDSKLRGCDLVRLKVADLVVGDRVRERVSVIQSKTNLPVQFEVTENTRASIWNWVARPEMLGCTFLFPIRFHDRQHVSTRQYARLVHDWVSAIGLEPGGYGTHSLRRTKAAQIYRKTGNLVVPHSVV